MFEEIWPIILELQYAKVNDKINQRLFRIKLINNSPMEKPEQSISNPADQLHQKYVSTAVLCPFLTDFFSS